MRELLDTIKARRARRQLAQLESWERQRAKGKTRFVLHQALTFTVFMTVFRDLLALTSDGGSQLSDLRYHLIFYSLIGISLGWFQWWNQESKYKDSLLNRRLKTPLDNRIKPR